MKERISRRTWEQLSAYVDGQLSARERARVEERLQTDSHLQQALDDLRVTRSAVQSLGRLRAPRNFTLAPEMVGQRGERRPRLFNTFRLASVVSSLLFVVVLLGDLLGSARPALMPAQEVAAPMQFEAVEEAAPLAKSLEAEEMAVPEEARPMVEARAEDAAAEEEVVESLGADETSVVLPASPPESGLAHDPAADSEIPRAVSAPIAAIRVVEIVLGAFALVTGAVALSLSRRNRS